MTDDIFDKVSIDQETKALAKEMNLPEEKVKKAYMEAINELNNKAKIKGFIRVLVKKELKERLKN